MLKAQPSCFGQSCVKHLTYQYCRCNEINAGANSGPGGMSPDCDPTIAVFSANITDLEIHLSYTLPELPRRIIVEYGRDDIQQSH